MFGPRQPSNCASSQEVNATKKIKHKEIIDTIQITHQRKQDNYFTVLPVNTVINEIFILYTKSTTEKDVSVVILGSEKEDGLHNVQSMKTNTMYKLDLDLKKGGLVQFVIRNVPRSRNAAQENLNIASDDYKLFLFYTA